MRTCHMSLAVSATKNVGPAASASPPGAAALAASTSASAAAAAASLARVAMPIASAHTTCARRHRSLKGLGLHGQLGAWGDAHRIRAHHQVHGVARHLGDSRRWRRNALAMAPGCRLQKRMALQMLSVAVGHVTMLLLNRKYTCDGALQPPRRH